MKPVKEATIIYLDTVVDKWNELFGADEINFGDLDLPEEETVFCATAKFDDGCEADIKVCTSSIDIVSGTGTVWAEAVLFDEDSHELTATEPDCRLEGKWILETDSTTYIVNFKRISQIDG